MQFKKFEATDMRAALAQIKRELGPDAVIVSTRALKGGLFRASRLEVTVGVEPPALSAKAAPEPRAPELSERALEGKLDPLRRELRALRGAMRAESRPEVPEALQAELVALRQALGALSARIEQPSFAVGPHQAAALAGRGPLPFAGPPDLAAALAAADVAPEICDPWLGALAAEVPRRPGEPPALWTARQLEALGARVARELPCDAGFFQVPGPRRVALVGPTGIGKTTTLAKIAAHMALRHRQPVALISLDSYRVGAFEQLAAYANLMVLPLVAAHDETSFVAALERLREASLILIDTAGRGPHAVGEQRGALHEMFVRHGVQTFLTVAAATRQAELHETMAAFLPLEPQGLVFTKLDEARSLSALVNASRAAQLPIAFTTDGQRVPEDIALPDAHALAQRIVQGWAPGPTLAARPRRPAGGAAQAGWAQA